jgi:hypothetical protein
MWIKSRRCADARFMFAALLVGTVAWTAPRPASVAGVKLEGFHIPGLHLVAREDHPVEEGGVTLSYADAEGEVRAVVRVAVAADHLGARRFVEREQSAISTYLAEKSGAEYGDPAFIDANASLIIAAVANLGYSVRLTAPLHATGSAIAAELRARIVAGVPSFPVPAVSVPAEADAKEGARVRVDPRPGTQVRLRAEGAWVQAHPDGPVLRPFAPGKVEVIAIAVDALGRVGVQRLEVQAR